jgi:hypothetical protein
VTYKEQESLPAVLEAGKSFVLRDRTVEGLEGQTDPEKKPRDHITSQRPAASCMPVPHACNPS